MNHKALYYRLTRLPDLSLAKYVALEQSGVEGVLAQHAAFWRQFHRRGLSLQGEGMHFLLDYDPQRERGRRMQAGLRFDHAGNGHGLLSAMMTSSPLAAYYALAPFTPGEKKDLNPLRRYGFHVHLLKKEIFTQRQDGSYGSYYSVSRWEANDEARLYTMGRLIQAAGLPCIYCVSIYPRELDQALERSLKSVLSTLRESARPAFTVGSMTSSRERDEGAQHTLKYYEDLLEELRNSPHFLVDAMVLSDDEFHAGAVLDAAVSEALCRGAHQLAFYEQKASLCELLDEVPDPSAPDSIALPFPTGASENAATLRCLPHLMTLEELRPLAVFPALFPGEDVEMPRETDPDLYREGMLLGRDSRDREVYFPLKNLSKHAFLAGVPGSGKTNSMMHIIYTLHVRFGIPMLIMEPAKHEYRVLTTLPGMEDLELYSPNAFTRFPLHLNPFEFPVGMSLGQHIANLLEVFEGAFTLDPPMPALLGDAITGVYLRHGWLPSMLCAEGMELDFPTMGELYEYMEEELEKRDYSDEIKGNLKSALQVRIGSLIAREMNDVFNVPYSSVPPGEWVVRTALLELESMGRGPANFTSLLISTLIRETLQVSDYQPPEDGRPRHIIFFEEAHNLIGPQANVTPGQEADPRAAATAYIVKMLAEVRALGEGIVIADQLPTAMAPEVLKNTSLKIALRMTAEDDRALLGSTMSAAADQLEELPVYEPGEALIIYQDMLKPFKMRIQYFKAKESVQSDSQILAFLCARSVRYATGLRRSLEIRRRYWDGQIRRLTAGQEAFPRNYLTPWRNAQARCTALSGDALIDAKVEEIQLERRTWEEMERLLRLAADVSLSVVCVLDAFACFWDARVPVTPELAQFRAEMTGVISNPECVRHLMKCVGWAKETLGTMPPDWERRIKEIQDLANRQKDILMCQGQAFHIPPLPEETTSKDGAGVGNAPRT